MAETAPPVPGLLPQDLLADGPPAPGPALPAGESAETSVDRVVRVIVQPLPRQVKPFPARPSPHICGGWHTRTGWTRRRGAPTSPPTALLISQPPRPHRLSHHTSQTRPTTTIESGSTHPGLSANPAKVHGQRTSQNPDFGHWLTLSLFPSNGSAGSAENSTRWPSLSSGRAVQPCCLMTGS